MQLTFTRKTPGVHTAQISNDIELALTNAGSVCGWHITLRDARTHKIKARISSHLGTLSEAKTVAGRVADSAWFAAALWKIS